MKEIDERTALIRKLSAAKEKISEAIDGLSVDLLIPDYAHSAFKGDPKFEADENMRKTSLEDAFIFFKSDIEALAKNRNKCRDALKKLSSL